MAATAAVAASVAARDATRLEILAFFFITLIFFRSP